MDDAFRAAMHRAIKAGEEIAPTVVSKMPGTSETESSVSLGAAFLASSLAAMRRAWPPGRHYLAGRRRAARRQSCT